MDVYCSQSKHGFMVIFFFASEKCLLCYKPYQLNIEQRFMCINLELLVKEGVAFVRGRQSTSVDVSVSLSVGPHNPRSTSVTFQGVAMQLKVMAW